MFTNTDMGSVLHVSVARCHWVILHLNDGDIKDLRKVGTMSSPRKLTPQYILTAEIFRFQFVHAFGVEMHNGEVIFYHQSACFS